MENFEKPSSSTLHSIVEKDVGISAESRRNSDSSDSKSEEVTCLTQEIASLRDELDHYKNQIFILKTEKESMEVNIGTSETSEEIESLKTLNSELQKQLDEASVTIEELTYQRDDLEERLDVEMGANQETEQEFEQIKKEMEAEVKRLLSIVDEKDSIVAELKVSLGDAEGALAAQSDKDELRSQVESLLLENSSLDESLNEKNAEVQEVLSCKNELMLQLEAEKSRVDALEAKMAAETTESYEKIVSLSSELGAWMSECEKQVTKMQKLTAYAGDLELDKSRMLEQKETFESQIESYQNDIEEIQNQNLGLNEELTSLRNVLQVQADDKRSFELQEGARSIEVEAMRQQLDEANAAMAQLATEKSFAVDVSSALEVELNKIKTDLKTIGEEKAEVQSILYDKTKELKTLQSQYDEILIRISEYEAGVSDNNSVSDELQQLKEIQAKTQSDLDAAIIEIDSVQKLLQATEEELLSVSSDIILRENEVETLSTELTEAQECHKAVTDDLKSKNCDLEDELIQLKEKLATCQNSNTSTETDIDNLKEQLSVEKSNCAKAQSDLHVLQQTCNERIESLEVQLKEKDQNLSETLQLLEEISPTTNVSDEEHFLLKEEYLALQSQLEEALLEKDCLSDKVNELNDQLNASSEMLSKTSAELKELVEYKESTSLQIKDMESEVLWMKEEREKLDQVEGDLSGADELICELQLKIVNLEKDVSDSALKIQVLEQSHAVELEEALNQSENLQNEVQSYHTEKQSLDEKNEQLCKELEKECENHKNSLETLQSRLMEAEEELLGVSSDNLRKDAELEQLRSDGKPEQGIDKSNALLSAQNSISVLEQRVLELEEQLAFASKTSVNKDNDLECFQKESSTEIQKLNSFIGQKEGEISKLLAEVTSLSERAATAEASLSVSIQQGNSTDADSDAQSKRCGQLQTQVDLLKGEKDILERKVSDLSEENRNLERDATTNERNLLNEVNSLRTQVAKLSEASQTASRQKDSMISLERRVEDLQLLLDKKASQISDLKQDLADERTSVQNLATELMEISSKSELDATTIRSLTDKLETAEADVQLRSQTQSSAVVQEEFEAMKASNEALVLENANLKREVTEGISLMDEQAAAMTEYSAKAEHHETTIHTLTKQLEDATTTIDHQAAKFSEEKTELLCRIDTLQQEMDSIIAAASEKRAQLMAVIEQLENDISQKDKEISLLSASSTASTESDEHLQLISEMNTLMEAKMEAEARIQASESETKQLRMQLSDYDKKSSKEVAALMEAAQTEMDNLKSCFDQERTEGYKQIAALQEKISAMEDATARTIECSKCTELESELDEAIASSNMVQLQHDETLHTLHALENEHKILRKEFSNHKTEMDELLEVKDQRIARLEKSKLTTDQMQKIKQVRENCTKKTEECKIYKKQLAQLKAAYETLQHTVSDTDSTKRSTRSSSKESNLSAEMAAVKLDLAEVNTQLEQANFVTKTLKDKLKDCSKQLQEYEQERQTIIQILEGCDIDITGLLLNDESTNDESILEEQELSEPVRKLAEKWRLADRLNSSLKSQLFDAEERFLTLSTDVESSRTQKVALEKKLESTKASLKLAKSEQEELVAQLESTRHRLSDVNDELDAAKSSLTGSKDEISSEIQVLEEENIELLRENKDLRISAATYRAKAEALARKLGTAADNESELSTCESFIGKRSVDLSESVASPDSAIKKKVKENNDDSIVTNGTQVQPSPMSRSFGTVLDENTIHVTASKSSQEPSAVTKPTSKVNGGRRGRRVKAKAVEVTSGETTEQPGECNQS